ncbi:chromosome partitioning protein ParA [Vibrio cortegadensis]|uniref:chromosome partitioning protein ParA n=1 Tax=Vibrio cortegadensis TaxID=1328770 RepID=UPI00352FCC4C
MTISATHAEIEQLYLSAELEKCRSICITACHSGDGVTSVAAALTERYLLAGHKTLLVDLNLFNPAFLDLELSSTQDGEHWLEYSETHQLFVGLPAPKETSTQLAYKDPITLQRKVAQWLNEYERIVIDTSPLLQVNKGNIPAQSVASACDCTLLVMLTGVTSAHHLTNAKSLLSASSINLFGCVMNMQQHPSLAQEIVRQLNKFKLIPKSLRAKLESVIYNNDFLNLPL